MTNGYVMVDCNGLNLLSESKVTINGIFDACKAAFESGKPIIATNCVYGEGFNMSPISVMAIYQSDKYCLSASILQIWVDEDDGCTIVSLLET